MNLRQIIQTSKLSSLIGAALGIWVGVIITVFAIYLAFKVGWFFIIVTPIAPLFLAWAILDEWNL